MLHFFFIMLKKTPWWVWLIFAELLMLGKMATKTRTVSKTRLFLIPALFLAWSLWTVFFKAPLMYAAFFLLSAQMSFLLAEKTTFRVFQKGKTVEIPGTYMVLALSLGLFFTKYTFGFLKAMQPEIAFQHAWIDVAISAGVAGFFFGRTLCIAQAMDRCKKEIII